jgi:hypothetical protein
VTTAVGELEQEYGNLVDFVIVPAEETKARQDEIDLYGFTAAMHGLVVFDRDGAPAVKMPGHQFGREEILAAMHEVLSAE